MIRADDVAPLGPGAPSCGDVLGRIDLKRRRALPDVRRPHRLVNAAGASDEEPAALVRRVLAGVRDDGLDDVLRDDDHAWTIIAVPMPPPMQSEAAPLPP